MIEDMDHPQSDLRTNIALHLSEGSPISLAGTPVPVDLLTKPFTVFLTGTTRPLWVEGNRLLRWFAEESRKTNKNHQDGDIGACLHFTDEMNKEDRCKWHIKATDHGLASMSEVKILMVT
ncbi:hypothetical protein BSKO_10077 [Bryopsis sp. KO-2023]|nr:hypothetical protein BSKO_10077 [Bryopsis sp. KO-2023]